LVSKAKNQTLGIFYLEKTISNYALTIRTREQQGMNYDFWSQSRKILVSPAPSSETNGFSAIKPK
jgi:hypothetical protein